MEEKLFDAWASRYEADVSACDEDGEYPFAGYQQVMDQLFDLIHAREGVSVLDLGCGTGTLLERASLAGHPVTGVDGSAQMLEATGKKLPQAELYCWDFANGLPQELAERRFDCIVASYSMHHLPDADKYALLRDLRQHLNEDGVVLVGDISFPNRQGLESCREAYGDQWDDSEYYFVRDELEQALPDFDVDCIPISFCADVLILMPDR